MIETHQYHGAFVSSEPDARFQSQLDWCLKLLLWSRQIEIAYQVSAVAGDRYQRIDLRHALCSAERRVRREVQEEALNAVLTFRVLQHDHEVTLSRKADLLALMASMRNGEATSIQDVGEDPWQSDEFHLLLLADREGKIVALRSRFDEFPAATPRAKSAADSYPGNSGAHNSLRIAFGPTLRF